MLAHQGQYSVVAQLSRTLGVSRPTMYAWKTQARQALKQAFRDPAAATILTPTIV